MFEDMTIICLSDMIKVDQSRSDWIKRQILYETHLSHLQLGKGKPTQDESEISPLRILKEKKKENSSVRLYCRITGRLEFSNALRSEAALEEKTVRCREIGNDALPIRLKRIRL